jgi:hypothetical protein
MWDSSVYWLIDRSVCWASSTIQAFFHGCKSTWLDRPIAPTLWFFNFLHSLLYIERTALSINGPFFTLTIVVTMFKSHHIFGECVCQHIFNLPFQSSIFPPFCHGRLKISAQTDIQGDKQELEASLWTSIKPKRWSFDRILSRST